ncbi:hypothetical protein FQZ97_843210 [compost metagenome]
MRLEPRHHLQDQTVAPLVSEGVIGVAEVVQVEMAEGQSAPFALHQPRRQQGLEALAVGDAGKRVLFGQALQGMLQVSPFADVAQGAAQGVEAKVLTHQPIGDALGRFSGFFFQQQDDRQRAPPGGRKQARSTEHQGAVEFVRQAAGGIPGARGNQRGRAAHRAQQLAKGFRPGRRFRQQEHAHGLNERGQMTSPRSQMLRRFRARLRLIRRRAFYASLRGLPRNAGAGGTIVLLARNFPSTTQRQGRCVTVAQRYFGTPRPAC